MAEPLPAPSPRPADVVDGQVASPTEEKDSHASMAEAPPPTPNGVDNPARSHDTVPPLPATMDTPSSAQPGPDVKVEHVPHDSDRLADQPETETWDNSPTKSRPRPPDSREHTEDAKEPASRRSSDAQAAPTTASNATPTPRKQTNGTIGSIYSGNKIRHLKKDDGVPLWRKDIQFKFLTLVFEDETPVFTRASDGQTGLPFADVYVDAMTKSSKTSRVLKEKLRHDRAAAINMAKVCLLVNFGRMNTTLNCKTPSVPSSFPFFCRGTPSISDTPPSFSGDARSTADLSPYSCPPSAYRRLQHLQAAAGCSSPEIDPKGGFRRLEPAFYDRKAQETASASDKSRQPSFRPVAVRAQSLRASLFPAARLFRSCPWFNAE